MAGRQGKLYPSELPGSLNFLDNDDVNVPNSTSDNRSENRLNNWEASRNISRPSGSKVNPNISFPGFNIGNTRSDRQAAYRQAEESSHKDNTANNLDSSPDVGRRHHTPSTFPRTKITPVMPLDQRISLEQLRQHMTFSDVEEGSQASPTQNNTRYVPRRDNSVEMSMERNHVGSLSSRLSESSSNDRRWQKNIADNEEQLNNHQVIDRLLQIRDYIKQSTAMMDSLQAAGEPGDLVRASQLEYVISRLREQEQKCLSLLLALSGRYNNYTNTESESDDQPLELPASEETSTNGDENSQVNEYRPRIESKLGVRPVDDNLAYSGVSSRADDPDSTLLASDPDATDQIAFVNRRYALEDELYDKRRQLQLLKDEHSRLQALVVNQQQGDTDRRSKELEALQEQQQLLRTLVEQQQELKELQHHQAHLLALKRNTQQLLAEEQAKKQPEPDAEEVDPELEEIFARLEEANRAPQENEEEFRPLTPVAIAIDEPDAEEEEYLKDKLKQLHHKKEQMDRLLRELDILRSQAALSPDQLQADNYEAECVKSITAAAAGTEQHGQTLLRTIEAQRKLEKLKEVHDRLAELKSLVGLCDEQTTSNAGDNQAALNYRLAITDGYDAVQDRDSVSLSSNQPELVDDATMDGKVKRLRAAKEKLQRLQELLVIMQDSPDLALSMPEDEGAVGGLSLREACEDSAINEEDIYRETIQKQQVELQQLREERQRLLNLQLDLQKLHDNPPQVKASVPTVKPKVSDVPVGAAESLPKDPPLAARPSTSGDGAQAVRKVVRKPQEGKQATRSAAESTGVTFQEPLETVISNEELYGRMRQQRMLREELRDKKRELENMMHKERPKKQYLKNQDNHSDNVSYSLKSDTYGGSASQDQTMATWGSSTADNMESIEEDEGVSGGDGQEMEEDDGYPSDGIVQVEEEEEAAGSDSDGRDTYTIETRGRTRTKQQGYGAPFQGRNTRDANYNYWASEKRRQATVAKERAKVQRASLKDDVRNLKKMVEDLSQNVLQISSRLATENSQATGVNSNLQQYVGQLQQQQLLLQLSQLQTQLCSQHRTMEQRLGQLEQSFTSSSYMSPLQVSPPRPPQPPVTWLTVGGTPQQGALVKEILKPAPNGTLYGDRAVASADSYRQADSDGVSQSSIPGEEECTGAGDDLANSEQGIRNPPSGQFDTLRETIYSEVASLISQNENRPYFLIRAFREMQHLNNDYLRQYFLQLLEDMLKSYLPGDEPAVGAADMNHSNSAAAYYGETYYPADYANTDNTALSQAMEEAENTDDKQSSTDERQASVGVVQTGELEAQIRGVMTDVIPVLQRYMDHMCTPKLLATIAQLVMTFTRRVTRSWGDLPQLRHYLQNQLATMLTDSLAKYHGKRMRDCGEDLLVDLSEVLFSELAFFSMMQELDTDPDKNKEDADDDAVNSEDQGSDDVVEYEDSEDDEEGPADIFQKSGCTAIEVSPNERDNDRNLDLEDGGLNDYNDDDESGYRRFQLTSSETKPMNRIGSDEDTDEMDESAEQEEPADTAVSHTYQDTENLSTGVYFQYSAPPVSSALLVNSTVQPKLTNGTADEEITLEDLPRKLTHLSKEDLDSQLLHEQHMNRLLMLQEVSGQVLLAGDPTVIHEPNSGNGEQLNDETAAMDQEK